MNDNTIRKLAAIMFVDIVGYSKMMNRDEETTFKLLEEYDSIVAPIIGQHHGSILKKIGDGLFCEFSSAVEAVECSIAIQKSLHNYNQTSSTDFQLMVRIGIHVGDVIKKGEDLFGDGVNVAARIEPLAPPGGIYVSESIHSAISSHPKFIIRNVGPASLKNINIKHELYQVISGFEPALKVNEKKGKIAAETAIDRKKIPKTMKSGEKFVHKIKYFIVSAVIVIVIAIVFNKPILNILNSKSLINNQKPINAEVEKVIKSAKTQKFISDMTHIKNSTAALDYLKKGQNEGNLTFGRQSDFQNTEGKYIIILDEDKISSFLLCYNLKYIDLTTNKIHNDLSEYFRGKRVIWIELL